MGVSFLGEGDFTWPRELEKNSYRAEAKSGSIDDVIQAMGAAQELHKRTNDFPTPKKKAGDGFIRVWASQSVAWAKGPSRQKLQKAADQIVLKCDGALNNRGSGDKKSKAAVKRIKAAALAYSKSLDKKELEKQIETTLRAMIDGFQKEVKKSFKQIVQGFKKLARSRHPKIQEAKDKIDAMEGADERGASRLREDAAKALQDGCREMSDLLGDCIAASKKGVKPPGLNDRQIRALNTVRTLLLRTVNTRAAALFDGKEPREIHRMIDEVKQQAAQFDQIANALEIK